MQWFFERSERTSIYAGGYFTYSNCIIDLQIDSALDTEKFENNTAVIEMVEVAQHTFADLQKGNFFIWTKTSMKTRVQEVFI